MVEEATAAAHSLAREAEALFELVRQFKIGTEVTFKQNSVISGATNARPTASPARQMIAKVNHSFKGNAALASEWEEF
ncbi:hypothetical protein D3Y55_32215 (plasmid) [Mesorhizobium sp. DCY119]|nr:hypothetical protein D3Y55_32215 [Mesorhizobium sp. DCY119]